MDLSPDGKAVYDGQKPFALTASRLTVVELANVPLGFGTLTPSSATAGSSTPLTIRGSGFQAGAPVTIGDKSASASFVDMNTLNVTVPPSSASVPGD